MKKLTTVLLLNLLFILSSKAQLAPVKNLKWEHKYQMPHNCFSLSWSKPDTSLTDTLVGYNIYRDQSLYSFTTKLDHICDPCIGAPATAPFCDFLNFTGNSGSIGKFYMHVTAVYSYNHKESPFTDSIFNGGIAIGIEDVLLKDAVTISTIIQDKFLIRIELNRTAAQGELLISNAMGQTIRVIALNNQKSIEINRSGFKPGFYFLNLKTKEGIVSKKIAIE